MSETLADVRRLERFADAYREWIIGYLNPERNMSVLLEALFEYEFTWILDRDENRAEDGCYLRVRFEEESGMECKASYIEWPCSLLEMLMALAIKIEDTVMYKPDKGDRTAKWFWMMIDNLKIGYLTNDLWSEDPKGTSLYLNTVVDVLLNRKYTKNGHGGLFPMYGKLPEDQRNVEIWAQMNLYMEHIKDD